MNRYTSAATAAAIVTAALLSACNNDNITSFNDNPNAPTTAPAPAVFTNAVRTATQTWLGANYGLRDLGLLIQHFAEDAYVANDQYKGVGPSAQSTLFQGAYVGDLEDFQIVNRAGVTANDPTISAPAVIMQQWEFGFLTDTWGDVPYSQALALDSSTAVLAPAYDAQKDIYTGIFSKLTAAATSLQGKTSGSLGSADQIYGGNPAQWQKFANSLHARQALRLVNADPATASAELKAAFTAPGGVFTSNADIAKLSWPGDGIFNNPWALNFASRDDDRMSKTFMDTLNRYNDPRVPIYAMPADANGQYVGMPNGLNTAPATAYTATSSRPGAFLFPGTVPYGKGSYGGNGNKAPSYLMTYAEVALIQAEAAERSLGGLTPGQAAGFYNAGITASLNQWGITDVAVIAAYLAQPQVVYAGGTAGLRQIGLQKWIALYTDEGQAWFEWRRTCTPSLTPVALGIYSYVPRRLQYPTIERSSNNAQIALAVTRMGGDSPGTRMYVDKTGAPTCP